MKILQPLCDYDKKYLKLSLPSALEGIFMILLCNVDLIMVGTLGTAAIAAVSIFSQPRMMILCVTRSIASALTLFVARKVGEEDHASADDILKKTLFVSTILLLFLHVIFYIHLEDILLWMGATQDYLPSALIYANIVLVSVFITSLSTILQALLIGAGDTGNVLMTNLVGNVVNIIINALLIFGLGPFPALGVKGAAIGTVIGTFVTLFLTWKKLRAGGYLKGLDSYLPTKAYFKEFLPVFGGIFSEQGFERVGMVLYTRMVAELGIVAFAIHSICMNFCDFYYNFASGLGKGSMVLVGQSLGRKNHIMAISFLHTSMKWGVIFSTIAFIFTYVFRMELFQIYSSDPSLLEMGMLTMGIVALVSYPEAHAMICAGVLRATGRTTQVAAYSFVSIAIVRPIVTAVFLYHLGLGLLGAWLALALDQSMRALFSWYLIRRVPELEHVHLQMNADSKIIR